MKTIKLGIIGLSEGNGHPYSWSAIINGYDPVTMKHCPFPVIPEYLAKQVFPDAKIPNAAVTHIWTQDIQISSHIASTTFIPHIVENMEQLITEVDGILLARDDAENHLSMARPFLEAGLPIYIDKPLARTVKEAELLFSLQKYPGQIFTCSAFQYSREIMQVQRKNISEKIIHINAYIKKDWNNYAIHLIEPILKIIGHSPDIKQRTTMITDTKTAVSFILSNDISMNISTFKNMNVKPTIQFFTQDDVITVEFMDVFFAFKFALNQFIEGMKQRKALCNQALVLRSIEMLESVNNQNEFYNNDIIQSVQ